MPPKPCNYFLLHGNCQRANCKFSHDTALVNGRELCRNFLKGRCERTDCWYFHDYKLRDVIQAVGRKRRRVDNDTDPGSWEDHAQRSTSTQGVSSGAPSYTAARTAASYTAAPSAGSQWWCTDGFSAPSGERTGTKRARTEDRLLSNGVSSGATSTSHSSAAPAAASSSATHPAIPTGTSSSSPPSSMASSASLGQHFNDFINARPPRLTIPVRDTQMAPQGHPMRIGNLPDDVLRYMSDFLTPKDQVQLSATCTSAYHLYAKRVICFILDNTSSMTYNDRFRQQFQVAKLFLEGLAQTAQVVLTLVMPPAMVDDAYLDTFAAFDGHRPRTPAEALQLLDLYLSSPLLPNTFYSANLTPLITCISDAVNRGFKQIVCLTDGLDNACASLASVVVGGQVVSTIIAEHNGRLDVSSPMRIQESDGLLAAFLQAMASRHGRDLIFPTIVGIGKVVIKECLPGFEALHVPQNATPVANRARLLTVTQESGGGEGSRRRAHLTVIRQLMDAKKRQLKSSQYTADSQAVFHRALNTQLILEEEEGEIPAGWENPLLGEGDGAGSGTGMDDDDDDDDDLEDDQDGGDAAVLAVDDDMNNVHTTTPVVEGGIGSPATEGGTHSPTAAAAAAVRSMVRVLGDVLPTSGHSLLRIWLIRDVNMRMRNDVTITIPGWSRRGEGDDNNYMDWQSDHLRVAQREIELTHAEAQRTWAAMTEDAKTALLDAAAAFFHQQPTRVKPIKTAATVADYRRYLQLLRENNAQAADEMDTRFPGIMPLLGVGCYFWVHHRDGNGETLHERLLHRVRAAMGVASPTVVVASSTPTSCVSTVSAMAQTATRGAADAAILDFDDEESYDGVDSGGAAAAAAVAAVPSTEATSDVAPGTTVDPPAIAADDATANGDDSMEMDGDGDDQDTCAATLVEEANDVTDASDWENDLPVLLPARVVSLIDTSHDEATGIPLDMHMDMDIDATDTGHVAEPGPEDASHDHSPLAVMESPLAALRDTAASTPPDTDDRALDQQGTHDGLEAPATSEKVTTICEGTHRARSPLLHEAWKHNIRKGDTVEARDEQGHVRAARVLQVDTEGNLVVRYGTGEFEWILARDFDRRIASWQDGHLRAESVPTVSGTAPTDPRLVAEDRDTGSSSNGGTGSGSENAPMQAAHVEFGTHLRTALQAHGISALRMEAVLQVLRQEDVSSLAVWQALTPSELSRLLETHRETLTVGLRTALRLIHAP